MQAALPSGRCTRSSNSSSRWGRPAAARSRKHRTCVIARAAPQIKVVGVGGHASRLVGQLWDNEACSHLEMLIINTDVQELSATFLPDQDKLLIGSSVTKWAGTGGNLTLGQEAAEEDSGNIGRALEDADVVLLLAGLGGGTGRGAGPVVADIARQQGAFTVGVALVPGQQHGSPHVDVVLAGLQSAASALVVLPVGVGSSLEQLPMTCLVAGIAELLMGYDAVDLGDLQEAVAGGRSTLRFAAAKGPGGVTRAVFAALSSTQDCLSDQSATGVLCFIAGAEELEEGQMQEVRDVLSSQCSAAHTLLVRAVRGVEVQPPGAVAVAVLTTTPARSIAKELADEQQQQQQQLLSAGKGDGEPGSGAAARPLADVADAAAAAGAVDSEDDGAAVEEGQPHEEG